MIYIKGFTPLEIRTKGAAVTSGNLSLTGFTLMEMMIVVIIIGILAGIALPLYSKAVERGRITEAVNMLGTIRDGQLRYAAVYGNYTADLNFLEMGNLHNSSKYFVYHSSTSNPFFSNYNADPYDNQDDIVALAVRNWNLDGVYSENYLIFVNESGGLYSNDTQVDRLFN